MLTLAVRAPSLTRRAAANGFFLPFGSDHGNATVARLTQSKARNTRISPTGVKLLRNEAVRERCAMVHVIACNFVLLIVSLAAVARESGAI